MSLKSIGPQRGGGEVLRAGLFKKLKTSRKKWFVLRAETPETSARLEYYDSEKKFLNGQPPKRSIALKTCFNINRRNDTKYKYVIALYTKDDCFCIVLDCEEELELWLKDLLSLQHGEEAADGEAPRPTFEHVWQVAVLNRGLGTGRIGNYRLCLSDKTLCLVNQDGKSSLNLNLSNIRSCGSLKHFFFLEIGRSSQLGAGELWMESIDTTIAQNIHTTIFHAMCVNNKNDEMRVRSSSATESSKPSSNTYRKQHVVVTSGVPKTTATPHVTAHSRERCDSMPSRPSEGNQLLPHWKPYLAPYRSHGRDISHSPPSGSPISPPSVGCSTDSTGSTYSLPDETEMMCLECPETGRYNGIALTPDEAIAEEDCSENPGDMYNSHIHRTLQSSDDGYVDMAYRTGNDINSPTASVSSVVSGTPSTDIRFSDYPLDKVTSYLVCDEDCTRPTRAYSFGSKPETFRGKKHVDLSDSARVRAFSMGSNARKGPSRILNPQHHPSLKSISAPILSNSRSHSSHSSNDRMDDLMLLDFSKVSNNNNSDVTDATTNNGYVEMKLGVEISPKQREVSPYVDMSGSAYMDMRGSSPSLRNEQEYNSSFVDINRQYKLPSNNNYVDMDSRRNRVKPSSSPASNSDYFDMSGCTNHSRRSERGSSFSSQVSTSSSPRNSDYLPMNFSPQEQSKTPEGYVEMSMGKKHQRQGSLDGSQSSGHNDDYLNMSVAPKKKLTKNQTSQPISILQTTTRSQPTKNSSSPISSSFLGRKSSTGTPPKMHLPLSSWSSASLYSSLPRTRARKDSRDSSSSSVTTPSSSSTIFPMSLNSPSSPFKANKPETPSSRIAPSFLNMYKSTGKLAPSEDYAFMDYESNRNEKNKENTDYVNFAPASNRRIGSDDSFDRNIRKENSSGDYAIMQPTTKVRDSADRRDSLDTSPLIGHLSMIGIKESQSMCFQPIKEDTAHSPLNEVVNKTNDSDYMELGLSNGVSPSSKISRPNSVNSETGGKSTVPSSNSDKSRPSSVSLDASRSIASRPSSTSSELWSSSSTLVNSRPESVNSDRIESSRAVKETKEETTENKLLYASLDLIAQEEENRGDGAGGVQGEPTFVYAEIDFVKSEGLKQNKQNLGGSNAKVKN